MKKALILLIMLLMCILTLTLAVSAEEYTVSTSDEFNTAFASAQDGDTIVITADISTNFDFGKTITYILDGGVRWTANAGYVSGVDVNTAEGKTVSIYSRNGNGVWYPYDSRGMWCNDGYYSYDFNETTWNIGSLDGNKMTIDLSNITGRLFYGSPANEIKFKEINFLPGAVVSGANKTAQDGNLFKAATINMYEGAEFFGNNSVNVMLDAGTFNMYGGMIYGNVCGYGNGFLNASIINMYGGEIFMNYQTYSYGNGYGLINAINGLYIYGGSIHNNIGRATDKYGLVISNNAGYNKPLYQWGNDAIHDNYSTTALTVERNSSGYFVEYDSATDTWGTYDESAKKYTGIQAPAANSVQFLDVTAVSSGMGFKVTNFDYSVIFKEANSKVIDAFMVKDGAVLKSVSALKEVTAPEGYTWASKANYCEAVTPVTNAQGTYYVAVAHTFEGDDHDCTTGESCTVCPYEIAGLAHNLVESLTYTKYTENGTYICDCTNEGCTVMDKNEKTPPIFITSGYSVSEAGSIMQGFAVDREVLGEFTRVNGNIITFGMVAGVKGEAYNTLDGKLFNADGTKRNDRVAVVDYTSLNYDVMEMVVSGLNLYPEVEVYCCLYYMVNGNAYYVNETTEADTTTAVSYAVKFPELFEAVVSNEE